MEEESSRGGEEGAVLDVRWTGLSGVPITTEGGPFSEGSLKYVSGRALLCTESVLIYY